MPAKKPEVSLPLPAEVVNKKDCLNLFINQLTKQRYAKVQLPGGDGMARPAKKLRPDHPIVTRYEINCHFTHRKFYDPARSRDYSNRYVLL
jgi:hypothetical protein